jgi:hypothetical protein
VVRKGQIVKILVAFRRVRDTTDIEEYIACQRLHKSKGLIGEVIEINYAGDGLYNILILLQACGELHPILVSPDQIEIETLPTLRSYAKKRI